MVPSLRPGEIATAIIQIKPGKALTKEEVNTFCTDLPRYKRPRKIIFDSVPRNPTGKIEKPKLRKIYAGAEETLKIDARVRGSTLKEKFDFLRFFQS